MLLRRLFFVSLSLILIITFILSGAYYLLLLIVILFMLMMISLFSMLFMLKKIRFQILKSNNEYYLKYQGKGFFPVGRMQIHFDVRNIFLNTSIPMKIDFLAGCPNILIPLDASMFKMGKTELVLTSFRMIDMLGIFSKKIKYTTAIETFIAPVIEKKDSLFEMEMGRKLQAYQRQKNEDYDLREYREGDSFKDIHYKVSYRQSKLMIKDKFKQSGFDMDVFIDLSGDELSCQNVFSYLESFIHQLLLQNGKCMLHWYSKELLMEVKICDLHEYEEALRKILSFPKAQLRLTTAEWIITDHGIIGGE